MAVQPPVVDEAIAKKIEQAIRADLEDALDTHKHPKLESYSLVDAAKKKATELFPEADDDTLKEDQGHLREAEGANLPRSDPPKARASGQTKIQYDPRYLDRNQRAAANARFGCVHARRDAGPGYGNARNGRRCPAPGFARRRIAQAIHDALQLPAVLGRRSGVLARSRPP